MCRLSVRSCETVVETFPTDARQWRGGGYLGIGAAALTVPAGILVWVVVGSFGGFLLMLVIPVGYIVGFRFTNGLIGAIGMVLVVLAVGFVFSWISAVVALAIKEVEGVQAAMFTGIFPIVFISSALVPVQGMVSWIQPIAKHNPVTIWANCARVLALGDVALPTDPGTKIPTTSLEGLLVLSTIWIVGLLIVFVPVSIRMYRKLT